MKVKLLFLAITCCLFLPVSNDVFAFDLKKGNVSFETEVIADDYGYSLSQYGFLFQDRWSALVRGFVVEPDILRHGEFEIGPTFRFTLLGKDFEVLNTFGFTNDGSFTTGHTVLTKIFNKPLTLIVDPKWYFWNRAIPDNIFHRLVIGNLFSICGVSVSLRSEHVTDYNDDISWRIGPQISLFPETLKHLFGDTSTFTLMPHYEARQNTFGAIITITINQ